MRSSDRHARRLGLFLLVGLPAFIVAVPLNAALVEWARLAKPPAYAVVMVCQVTVNFALCRRYVFPEGRAGDIYRQYFSFLGSIGVFRILDWVVYSLLVQVFPGYYIVIQLGNVMVFSVLKYIVSHWIFRGRTNQAR